MTYTYTESDVEYYRHGDQPLVARLYKPDGPGPFPAVVNVHGGGWTSGDRFGTSDIDVYLAANGIVVLALEFRLGDAARYPGQVADVNAGIRWLKAHAAEVGSRTALVGGIGSSSGGQVILLNALRPADPALAALPLPDHPAITAELAYVVACWPVADPLARYHMARDRGNARLVESHHVFWPGVAEMTAGSPQLVLERGEATHLPPALILQGTADDNLPADMGARFGAAYRAAGGSADVHIFEGQPHGFIKQDPSGEAARRALALIAAFVQDKSRAAAG